MIKGMDISTLEEVERLGGKFYDEGRERDLLTILDDHGVTDIRLRLWVNPYDAQGRSYGAGNCDIETVIRLARRVKAMDMKLLLDLHYSDFWTDPGKQTLPKAWQFLSLAELTKKVYTYTAGTLQRFKNEGVCPDYVQVGNEITNGMLWNVGKLYDEGTAVRGGYDNLARLLSAGIEAVREQSDAKAILHLERSGDLRVYQEWFDNICKRGVDFDLIGVSYYPYWHGTFSMLSANLNNLIARYDKDIMVVETSYAHTVKPFITETEGRRQKLVVGEDFQAPPESPLPYPMTEEGQSEFIAKLMELLAKLPNGRGKGFFWWEPAWLPVEGTTWASEAARKYIGETEKEGGNEWANQGLFSYDGHALKALKTIRDYEQRK